MVVAGGVPNENGGTLVFPDLGGEDFLPGDGEDVQAHLGRFGQIQHEPDGLVIVGDVWGG